MHIQPLAPSIFSGRVVIIGATSGIGRELAVIYAGRGYKVAVSGRRNDLLVLLQKSFPENIITECFDVTQTENIRHLQNMIDNLGGLDLLIYCSGYGKITAELNRDINKQTTDVMVNGFAAVISYTFNYFASQGFGQIAGISSVAALRGNANAPAYNAAKAWQSNYLEGLYFKAKKLKLSLQVTDIRPGFVDTALAKGAGKFWVASPQKAAQQITVSIQNKKKIAYVTRRWWLVATVLKHLPDFIYRKIGRHL